MELAAMGLQLQKQSGVGTDIKYSAFNFTDEYIGYMKVYAPETPIISIDGNSFDANQIITLSNGRGSWRFKTTETYFLSAPVMTWMAI